MLARRKSKGYQRLHDLSDLRELRSRCVYLPNKVTTLREEDAMSKELIVIRRVAKVIRVIRGEKVLARSRLSASQRRYHRKSE